MNFTMYHMTCTSNSSTRNEVISFEVVAPIYISNYKCIGDTKVSSCLAVIGQTEITDSLRLKVAGHVGTRPRAVMEAGDLIRIVQKDRPTRGSKAATYYPVFERLKPYWLMNSSSFSGPRDP